MALVFDSGHYQETAHLILGAPRAKENLGALQVKANLGAPLVKEKQVLARALMLDGPVLPGLAAAVIAIGGKIGAFSDWQCLLSLQAFLHSISAALLFFIAREFFPKSQKWALAAGLLWAVDPIAVLSSQRFLSENLATVLLLSFVLLLCNIVRTGFTNRLMLFLLSLAAGLTAALILFAKTGLAPTAALSLALTAIFLCKRPNQTEGEKTNVSPLEKVLPLLIGAFSGVCIVIAPWAMYTQGAMGEAQYFPQRAPVLNLFVGWNTDTDGLSTLPVAPVSKPLQALYTKTDSAPLAVLGLWQQEPIGCAMLALRKVSRLYSLPWNDFRRNCLFFSPKMQQWLHQVTMLLAVLSTCIAVGTGAPFAFGISLLTIVGHFTFLLFEAVPRYAYSSYPFILLLALFSVRTMFAGRWTRKTSFGGAVLALLLLAMIFERVPPAWFRFSSMDSAAALNTYSLSILLPLLMAPLLIVSSLRIITKSGRIPPRAGLRLSMAFVSAALLYSAVCFSQADHEYWQAEWQSKIAACQTAERVFTVPTKVEKPAFALLLIDAVRQLDLCEISVNGQQLTSKPINLFDYFPSRKTHYQFAEQVAALMGRSPSEIRHWWAVPVPLAALKLNPGVSNTIALRVPVNASLRLFGEYDPMESGGILQTARPGFLYVSPGKIWTSNDSFEWREGRPFSTRPLYGESTLVGAEGSRVKQKGQWRMMLLIGSQPDMAKELTTYEQSPEFCTDVF